MDAAQALADLIEISPQIEAAVLLDTEGGVEASTLADPARTEALAAAAAALLAEADQAMGGEEAREELVQLQASFVDGSVFAVREGSRLVAAVTAPDPTVGLVFYDLKTTLRHAAGEELAPKAVSRDGPLETTEQDADGEG